MMRIERARKGVYRAHFLIDEYGHTGVVTVTEARRGARVATTDKGVKVGLAQEIVRDAERAHELQMEIDAQWGPPQRTAAIKRERQQCRHRCTVGLRREMEATAVDLVKGRKTIVLRMLKGLRHKRVQDWQGELFSIGIPSWRSLTLFQTAFALPDRFALARPRPAYPHDAGTGPRRQRRAHPRCPPGE